METHKERSRDYDANEQGQGMIEWKRNAMVDFWEGNGWEVTRAEIVTDSNGQHVEIEVQREKKDTNTTSFGR